ncbi:MAG: adenosylcobinamide-GDP ribazoletransferase [Acidilobus sp.]
MLSLLTIIPAKGSGEGAARSFYAVPIIGLIEGSVVGGLGFALRQEPLLAASVMLLAHIIITGAMHLDGTADYGDVLGSRRRGGEALDVLKDPRRGAFGVTAVVAVLLTKLSALYYLASHPLLIVASYVIGLEGAYIAALLGKAEPYEGMARPIVGAVRTSRSIVANIAVTGLILGFLSALNVKALLELIGLTASIIVALDSDRRLGFVNGDVLGLSIESTEALALLVTAACG